MELPAAGARRARPPVVPAARQGRLWLTK
uniref:Uncharacterized protein n=1 Tax=Arundo donax TaxID=35708 RepID=A0A0A9B2D3_ARUDO